MIILFDTETTGLPKPSAAPLDKQPYIIEYYGVKIDNDFQILDEFETYIKPPIDISEEITKITGINDNDLVDAKEFKDVYDGLCEFHLGVDTLVAHNITFDTTMLSLELRRLDKLINFPWPKNHICTVEKSLHLKGFRLNLTRLHQELLNKGFEDAHRAKNDVFALVRCFHALVERGDIKL